MLKPEGLKEAPRGRLGKNVNRLRQQRELTQEELAEMAEIDRRYVQRIERGSANPGIDIIARLKNALGAEWTDLLD